MKVDVVVDMIRKLVKDETEAWHKAGNACFTDNDGGDVEKFFSEACQCTGNLIAFVLSVVDRDRSDLTEVSVNVDWQRRSPQGDKSA